MKNVIYVLFAVAAALTIPACSRIQNIAGTEEIRTEVIEVPGISKEFTILFLADSHISECDYRDEELIDKAKRRKEQMTVNGLNGLDHYNSFIETANDKNVDMVILGGDIVDSAMNKSIEAVNKGLNKLKCPYIYSFGNHDFEYGTEYYSAKAYEEYRLRFKEIRANDTSQLLEFEEFVILAADDENNQISEVALQDLKYAMTLKKPVLLVSHVPFEPQDDSNSLLEACKEVWGPSDTGLSRVTIGYGGKWPNAITEEFVEEAFGANSNVIGVLSGHIHFFHRDMINPQVPQIVTGAAYEGKATIIKLIPNKN